MMRSLRRFLTHSTTIWGIDKLTCSHGLALQHRGLDVLYGDASAHSERVLKAKHA